MGRSGYNDGDGGNEWGLICWRGAVKSALRGARGQAFLRELATAMDAMVDKRLTTDELIVNGQYCTLGVIGAARGMDLSKLDVEDWQTLSKAFGISEAMTRELMWENDECVGYWEARDAKVDAGAKRWEAMRKWVSAQITPPAAPPSDNRAEGR